MAQQAPDQPPESIILDKFSGLRNIVLPEKLKPDELAVSENIDLDDADQPHRRRGYTRKDTGNYHSLFASLAGPVYAVRDGVLGVINPDFTFRSLGHAITANPAAGTPQLAYVEIAGRIYFSSPSDSGVINMDTDAVTPWGNSADFWYSPVVNPTATLPDVAGRLFAKPPNARYLTSFNGRIYLAHGNTLWATELYLYNLIDKTKNYLQFEDEITGLGVVTDGIYVGTKGGLWFLTGTFKEIKRTAVLSSPVIHGSMVQMPSELANPQQVTLDSEQPARVSVLMLTEGGLCAAQDTGQAYNLTENAFQFPSMQSVAPMFRQQDGITQYVAVADTGGAPAGKAGFGDYVEAELIRGETQRYHQEVVYFGDHVDADYV